MSNLAVHKPRNATNVHTNTSSMAPRCWRQGAAALLVAVATVVPSDAVDDGACGFACYDLTGSLAGTPHQCTCTPEHCDKSACEQGGGIFIDNCDTDRPTCPCSCAGSPASHDESHADGQPALLGQEPDDRRRLQANTAGCTGSLVPSASGGTFDLDGGYGRHTDDCTYLLECTGAGLAPVVNWSHFATEAIFDYVELHDGSTAEATVMGRYHGVAVPPPLQASGSSLFVQLRSDASIAGEGFAGSWTCQPAGTLAPPSPDACLAGVSLVDGGTFSKTDDGYDNGHDCSWFLSCTAPNHAPRIEFSSLSLEADYDFVDVYDGSALSSPRLARYTGEATLVSPVLCNSASARVQLTADHSVTLDGFVANFTCEQVAPQTT